MAMTGTSDDEEDELSLSSHHHHHHYQLQEQQQQQQQHQQHDDEQQQGSVHKKPGFSYASLITQAIESSPEKKMTLSAIYSWVTLNYPYYQIRDVGWQVCFYCLLIINY
jgi:hypothetical protein